MIDDEDRSTLTHKQMLSGASAADGVCKLYNKMRKTLLFMRNFSFCHNVPNYFNNWLGGFFSTQFSHCLDTHKALYCRFVICGGGLHSSIVEGLVQVILPCKCLIPRRQGQVGLLLKIEHCLFLSTWT